MIIIYIKLVLYNFFAQIFLKGIHGLKNMKR